MPSGFSLEWWPCPPLSPDHTPTWSIHLLSSPWHGVACCGTQIVRYGQSPISWDSHNLENGYSMTFHKSLNLTKPPAGGRSGMSSSSTCFDRRHCSKCVVFCCVTNGCSMGGEGNKTWERAQSLSGQPNRWIVQNEQAQVPIQSQLLRQDIFLHLKKRQSPSNERHSRQMYLGKLEDWMSPQDF